LIPTSTLDFRNRYDFETSRVTGEGRKMRITVTQGDIAVNGAVVTVPEKSNVDVGINIQIEPMPDQFPVALLVTTEKT